MCDFAFASIVSYVQVLVQGNIGNKSIRVASVNMLFEWEQSCGHLTATFGGQKTA